MTNKTEKSVILFLEGVLFSYSQVFFSRQRIFALILMLVTFFDWNAGLSGLIAVVVTNLAAYLMGFRQNNISQGLYGFNSLLVGLGMGLLYQSGIEFFFVLVFASLFTFFLTIWLEGFFGKYGLPYLSWPFLLGIWMVSLASRQFTALEMSERGIFLLNQMYQYGGLDLVRLYFWVNELPLHESVRIYFRSLAAIFFQYHMLAGVLVAVGLLIYSRIAFLLSLIGFFSAYFYYLMIGANLAELSYSYIGFNFILTAIAIGGFFIVPSKYSFLWVILLTPVLSFVITSTGAFFQLLNLPIFSLAFNIVVVLFLYVLKFREKNLHYPELVAFPQYSPERNLFEQKNYRSRFDLNAQVSVGLPVFGEWKVTQAHNGEYTHREEWRHAWDFEVFDENGSNYDKSGFNPHDYYAFGKPVLAPADGIIQEIIEGIPDNPIGGINVENNWGNTIIIKHGEKLYSKLCHLKMGSIRVVKGGHVKRGDTIAQCGSSGRSSVPHLHFQLQSDPFIGSKTLDYPLAGYLLKTEKVHELKTYDRPLKGQLVSNINRDESLFNAFNFIPGQTLSFKERRSGTTESNVIWKVKVDLYNNKFLECDNSGSKAYFRNDGNLFYFTHFTGDKSTLLYYFYLGAYKVVMGFSDKLQIHDILPATEFRKSIMTFIQDFIAPFYIFLRADFELEYIKFEDDFTSASIRFRSAAKMKLVNKLMHSYNFEFFVNNGRIETFEVKTKGVHISAQEIKT